jgi:hypothetical protein
VWIDGYPEKNNQDKDICTFSVLLFGQLVEFAMPTIFWQTPFLFVQVQHE